MQRFLPWLAVVAYAGAALGLALTAYLLFQGLRVGFADYREADGLIGVWMTLLFVAGGAYVGVWHYGTMDVTRREAEKLMWSGCPKWMRIGAWTLCGIGAFLFFGQFAFEQFGWLPTSGGNKVPILVMVGFGLIWFTATAAQTYSVTRFIKQHEG